MKIYVLMGQRKERYPGEYAPEALECIHEYGHDDNPEYLAKAKALYDAEGEFENTAIIPLELSDAHIMKRLRPEATPIPAKVAE